MRLLLVPVAMVLLSADKSVKTDAAGDVPSVVTDANYAKLKQGMTKDQVVAVLGKPHRVQQDIFPGGTDLLWEDHNGISVRYVDGKAVRIEGRFNKHLKSPVVNEANYAALNAGMTRDEVEKVLKGCPMNRSHSEGNVVDAEYVHFRLIRVQIADGKVVGLAQESAELTAPPAPKP